jgi:ribonuclease HI
MELMAAIVALENLNYKCKVTLYSDSQYLVDSMSKGWVLSWRAKGWMRNKRERAANADLWMRLLDLTPQHEVEFIWIKGHADNPENIRCDFLSMRAAEGVNLPGDIEYENSEMASAASPSLFDKIPDSSAITDEPKLRKGWKEITQAEFDLAEVLQGVCGRENGDFIYVVRYCRIPVYIGMTRDTVNNRIWRHIKEHSNLGVAVMADRRKDFAGWSVLVIQVEGEIEAAERYHIRRVRPPMNIEDNNNNQENVTQTVRIFKRNYQPDPYLKYRRRKRRSERG